MQFPDSTWMALNLVKDEPSRFGRTLVAALVLTASSIGMALWVEIGSFDPAGAAPQATRSAAPPHAPSR